MSQLSRFLPLFDRVLIRRIAAETKTAGGVLLPETAQSKTNLGNVVAVGSGLRTADGKVLPLPVSVGDEVVLPEFGGQKLTLDNEDFLLVRDSEIVGVLQK